MNRYTIELKISNAVRNMQVLALTHKHAVLTVVKDLENTSKSYPVVRHGAVAKVWEQKTDIKKIFDVTGWMERRYEVEEV